VTGRQPGQPSQASVGLKCRSGFLRFAVGQGPSAAAWSGGYVGCARTDQKGLLMVDRRQGRIPVDSERTNLSVAVDVPRPGCVVLRPDGDIDHQTVAVLRDVLFDAFPRGVQTVIVDLDAVTFLGAKGVGALVEGHDRALVLGVTFVLAGGGHAALRPLQVLGIIEAISHHVSIEQALLPHPHLSQRVDPGPVER